MYLQIFLRAILADCFWENYSFNGILIKLTVTSIILYLYAKDNAKSASPLTVISSS